MVFYLSFWKLVALPRLYWTSDEGFYHVIFATTITGLMYFAYFMARNTDPGIVPSSYIPPNATEDELQEAKSRPKKHVRNTYYHRIKWCNKCKKFKPPRTHHCSCCKRCVVLMDHHCPWLNQCIGFYNRKLFINMLLYMDLGLIYFSLLLLSRFYGTFYGNEEPFTWFDVLLTVALIVILIWSLPGLIILFCQEIFYVSNNMTRIELWTKHWANYDAKERGEVYHYPYDLGKLKNFRQVFGQSYLLWILPIQGIIMEDPLQFPDLIPTKNGPQNV